MLSSVTEAQMPSLSACPSPLSDSALVLPKTPKRNATKTNQTRSQSTRCPIPTTNLNKNYGGSIITISQYTVKPNNQWPKISDDLRIVCSQLTHYGLCSFEDSRPTPRTHYQQLVLCEYSIFRIELNSYFSIWFDSKRAQLFEIFEYLPSIKSNQIKIYIAPYVHEDSEALGGWITCSRRVGIDEFLNVFWKTVNC